MRSAASNNLSARLQPASQMSARIKAGHQNSARWYGTTRLNEIVLNVTYIDANCCIGRLLGHACLNLKQPPFELLLGFTLSIDDGGLSQSVEVLDVRLRRQSMTACLHVEKELMTILLTGCAFDFGMIADEGRLARAADLGVNHAAEASSAAKMAGWAAARNTIYCVVFVQAITARHLGFCRCFALHCSKLLVQLHSSQLLAGFSELNGRFIGSGR